MLTRTRRPKVTGDRRSSVKNFFPPARGPLVLVGGTGRLPMLD